MTEHLKISQFINKNLAIISCFPTDNVAKAKTLMLLNDFSQLPIIDHDGSIKGAISWKSIGNAEALGKKNTAITDYMETAVILNESENFLRYMKLVAKKDYLLISNENDKLSGIITTYDMTMLFQTFFVPYLKLGIIEDVIRKILVNNKIPIPKEKDVQNLIFREYIDIFKNEENWRKLQNIHFEKDVFINKLDEIRIIRNKVAHYKPSEITAQDVSSVESFAEIMQKIE